MPRRETHAVISFIPLVIIFFTSRLMYDYPFLVLVSCALFTIGSLAPDIIEPSFFWTHRRFFHSIKLFFILFISAAILTGAWFLLLKSPYILFVASFLWGYCLHLILDSTTKMGLPSR